MVSGGLKKMFKAENTKLGKWKTNFGGSDLRKMAWKIKRTWR